MEDGPPIIGFEDGSVDVGSLLVEPQDVHVSVGSILCFKEKIPEKAVSMDDISWNLGVTNTGEARNSEGILNRDVLDSISSEADVGYFRLQNDFCSMGEDYLLGVGFSETMTNLDYGPSEGLLTSVSEISILASTASPWESDLYRIMELPDCQNDQLNIDSSDFVEVPSLCNNESETPTDQKSPRLPESSMSKDIDEFQNVSNNSQEMLPDGRVARFSSSIESSHNPRNEKDDDFGPTGQNVGSKRSEITTNRADCLGDITKPKRSRRPTQRYIDEFTDPFPRIPKRRRDGFYLTGKDKSVGVKCHKKCRVGSNKSLSLATEESSVVVIQVPFGSLVHKERPKSPDMKKDIGTWPKQVHTDRGVLTLESNDNQENQRRRDDFIIATHPLKSDQKTQHSVTSKTQVKRRGEFLTSPKQTKVVQATSPKKANCSKTGNKFRRDEFSTDESSEEVTGRRKHHRLWTIAEVKKLIDGVSEYGVGRWSRIKKVSFSSSAHRTSVDLKDKWRNLLKASLLQLGNQQGEKKRNMAWRPLPKSILRHVCELANLHPYPKGKGSTKRRIGRDSSDRSTNTTLSEYRKILGIINGN